MVLKTTPVFFETRKKQSDCAINICIKKFGKCHFETKVYHREFDFCVTLQNLSKSPCSVMVESRFVYFDLTIKQLLKSQNE